MPIIGRSYPADIVIPLPQVSACHAEISHIGDDLFELRDLDSTNGTFVEGRRIAAATIRLTDRVAFGSASVDLRPYAPLLLSPAPAPSPDIVWAPSASATASPIVFMYAGFWRRAAAALIDGLILLLLVFGLAIAVSLFAPVLRLDPDQLLAPVWGLALAMRWLYFVLYESSERQATPGKRIMGLRVVDLSGGRLSFGRATGRYFGKIVSAVILYIGFLMAAFTERKQALHDVMSGCLVIAADRARQQEFS